MSALRYSGELRIRVTYVEGKGYRCFIRGMPAHAHTGEGCTMWVGPPAYEHPPEHTQDCSKVHLL